MFNVKNNECIGFESRWTVKKVSTEGASQTTEYSTQNRAVNTSEKKSIEVQTEVEETATIQNEADMQKLADWLNRIYPKVKRELDDGYTSKAFNNYRLLSDTTETNCKLTQTINVSINSSASGDVTRRVSALSWNSTGKTIAVSCNYAHRTWCYHSGFVAFYTLTRNNQLPKVPNQKLTTESCVTVLQFHPILPNVIAVGTFSGDIIIHNIQYEDEEGENTELKKNGHKESITHLKWLNDLDSAKTIVLASSSLDGFLTIWNFSSNASTLIVKEKYKIKSPMFGRMQKPSKELKKKVVGGVICFDFSKFVPDMFVVGMEGGLIVQCSMLGTTELKGSTKTEPILDPVFKYYEKYEDEITSINFSPNSKQMFMTNGSDGEVRIYLIGQEEPAQVIFLKNPLNCLTWIPFEEKLIAGCGSNGLIEIFNVVEGKPIENTTNQKISSNILTQMEINKMKASTVAIGTENGELQLWSVPWNLFGNLAA